MTNGRILLICSVLDAKFGWDRENRKYISTIMKDGAPGIVCSRVPEKVWNEYKNGLSVMLMELAQNNKELEILAYPDWLVCRWNEKEAWATYSFGNPTKKVVACQGAIDAAGKLFRALCANIDRRLVTYRRG